MSDHLATGVSVVIPVYGNTPVLSLVIERVDAQLAQLQVPGEIVVVDDASPSPVILPPTHSKLRVLRNEENLGFGATANLGVHASVYDAVLLLNSDMVLQDGAVSVLLGALSREDFAVSPSIAIGEDEGPCESVSYIYLRHGSFNVGHLGMAHVELLPAEPTDIAYCCGGAMLVWRERFEYLGGFSALFSPYYWEDADLGLRAWRVGLRSRVVPSARAVHMHGQTIGRAHHVKVNAIRQAHRILWTLVSLDGWRVWCRYLAWAPLRVPYDVLRGFVPARSCITIAARLREIPKYFSARDSVESVLGRAMTTHEILRKFAPMAKAGRWGRL